jgi:hypothetical protein
VGTFTTCGLNPLLILVALNSSLLIGCSEFFVTKVGKLVHTKPELAAPGGVELLNELVVGLEHLELVCLLSVILLDHPLLVPRHHGRVIIGQFPSCKETLFMEGL